MEEAIGRPVADGLVEVLAVVVIPDRGEDQEATSAEAEDLEAGDRVIPGRSQNGS